jgi:uncharacterized membrane protein required for colicin V production
MDISSLLLFDYLIITVILAAGYIGWKNGLIVSFIAFFAWVGSAIIVIDSYDLVFGFINRQIPSRFISGFMASIGLYIVLVISFSLLGAKISKATEKFGGSTTDKVTGVVFGGLCGVLISSTIFWLCYMSLFTLNEKKLPEWFVGAKGYKILKITSDSLVNIAFSEEERHKLLNLMKDKGNQLEKEVKSNISKKKTDVDVANSDDDEY